MLCIPDYCELTQLEQQLDSYHTAVTTNIHKKKIVKGDQVLFCFIREYISPDSNLS